MYTVTDVEPLVQVSRANDLHVFLDIPVNSPVFVERRAMMDSMRSAKSVDKAREKGRAQRRPTSWVEANDHGLVSNARKLIDGPYQRDGSINLPSLRLALPAIVMGTWGICMPLASRLQEHLCTLACRQSKIGGFFATRREQFLCPSKPVDYANPNKANPVAWFPNSNERTTFGKTVVAAVPSNGFFTLAV